MNLLVFTRAFLFLFLLFPFFGVTYSQKQQVGQGSYNLTLPKGQIGPSTFAEIPNYPVPSKPAFPKVVEGFSKPIQTNDWWSSFIWNASASAYFNWDEHSWPSYAHPLAYKACRYGLKIKYPDQAKVFEFNGDAKGSYRYEMGTEDLTVTVDGMDLTNQKQTKVKDYSDWSFTALWDNGDNKSLIATMGHGFLYTYLTKTGGDIVIRFNGTPTIFYNGGNIIGVTINNHHYALFAPSGSTWNTNLKYSFDENESPTGSTTNVLKSAFKSSLNNKDYLSIAILPDNTIETLDKFKEHAYVFIDSTEVKWSFNEAKANLNTQYIFHTSIKEGTDTTTMYGLYRHQWLHMGKLSTSYSYVSPRGIMKVNEGNSFSISLKNFGIIPELPNVNSDNVQLNSFIEDETKQISFIGAFGDSYFGAINICREADLAMLAHQCGNNIARDKFLDFVQSSLEDWLQADNGETNSGYLYYDTTWNSLIAYNSSFGANSNLNDLHFHYGYFIKAASILALFRPNWARDEAFGGMVKLLIKHVANWNRKDNMFPYLRFYDAYAGHSWAGGSSGGWGGYYPWGADQEASGESMNFASATYLWGLNTKNDTIRDLGLFLFLNEKEAIEQYWFDIDNEVFPSAYPYVSGTRLWSSGIDKVPMDKGTHDEYLVGINVLPAYATALYLGINPDYINKNYQEMIDRNGGEPDFDKDLMCFYYSMYDSNEATNYFENNLKDDPTYDTQAITKAFLFNWLYSLDYLGKIDTTIIADYSSYTVFKKGDDLQYLVYNPGVERKVLFSNGYSFLIPADTLIVLDQREALGIKSAEVTDNIIIYPNPGKGNFKTSAMKESTELKLYNQLGEIVFAKHVNAGQILNFKVEKPGVYFLKFENNNESFSEKIISF